MPVTTSSLYTRVYVLFSSPMSSCQHHSRLPIPVSASSLTSPFYSLRLSDIYTFPTRESDDLFWKRAHAMAGYPMVRRRLLCNLPTAIAESVLALLRDNTMMALETRRSAIDCSFCAFRRSCEEYLERVGS
jgi:hypothetical protein